MSTFGGDYYGDSGSTRDFVVRGDGVGDLIIDVFVEWGENAVG